MYSIRTRACVLAGLCLSAVVAQSASAVPFPDIQVGIDDPSRINGQIKIMDDPIINMLMVGDLVIDLMPGTGEFGSGGAWDGYYVANSPAWASATIDIPPDFYYLPMSHSVALERNSTTAPGVFSMFTDDVVPTQFLTTDGDIRQFEQSPPLSGQFNEMLWFAAAPATPLGTVFSVEFTLINDEPGGKGMTESEPFNFTFRVMPEPSTLMLLGVAMLAVRRRRA